MYFFKFSAQSQDQVPLIVRVHIGVVKLGNRAVRSRILLPRLDQGQVFLSKQVDGHFVRLIPLDRCQQHLGKDSKLLIVPCLVGDFLDVFLFVVTSPDQALRFRLNVDD